MNQQFGKFCHDRCRGCPSFATGFIMVVIAVLLTFSNSYPFSLMPLNIVDPATGRYTGSIAPTLDDAPRWTTNSLSDSLSYRFGSWTIDATGTPKTQTLDVNGFFGLFTFGDGTTVNQFGNAVSGAFSTWKNSAWPIGNSPLSFALGTLDVGIPFTSWNPNSFPPASNLLVGNEIDIFGVNLGVTTYGLTFDWGTTDDLKLTNGFGFDSIGGLFPSSTILSVDLGMNTTFGGNPWTIDKWQAIFTHELGHTLGLGDIDVTGFWDNDNNVSNVLPINQAGDVREGIPFAPLPPVTVAAADGKILMCSTCPTRLTSLQNDDLAGIRFLYPVPEPSSLLLFGAGLILLFVSRAAPARS